MDHISVFAAFSGGVLSFLSPCVLPLLPAYLSFITGITFSSEDAAPEVQLRSTAINSLSFIAGFSIVFILLGAAASSAGQLLMEHLNLVKLFGGLLIMVFALFVLGAAKIPFLNYEARFRLKSRPAGYFGSFAAGIVFSAGWTPCVGPILGSILVLAAGQASVSKGMLLLAFYSLGLGLPFFLASLSVNSFLAYYKRFGRYIKYANLAAGLFLLATGAVLTAGALISLASGL